MDNTLFESLSEGERRAIQEERQWLDENKAAYEEAAGNLGDPLKVRIIFRSIQKRLEPLYSYDPSTDHGAVAPMLVGKVTESFDELLTDFNFVLTFEERRERLHDYIVNIEEQIRREQSADVSDRDQL